jgi:hypothetical protein
MGTLTSWSILSGYLRKNPYASSFAPVSSSLRFWQYFRLDLVSLIVLDAYVREVSFFVFLVPLPLLLQFLLQIRYSFILSFGCFSEGIYDLLVTGCFC